MQFIRKHAAPLALLASLLAAFAAPYLIPENPDSAVFRSGAFGLVLLAAAAFPAWEAMRRADRRTLVCGLIWGLLLAAGLPWAEGALVPLLARVPPLVTYGLLLVFTADAVCSLRFLRVTGDVDGL